ELTEVKLNQAPVVGVNSAKPNLEFLTMSVDASVESLEVETSRSLLRTSMLVGE
ncbi:hypothetical protein L9F63_011859, partial [Diploptera punctata]